MQKDERSSSAASLLLPAGVGLNHVIPWPGVDCRMRPVPEKSCLPFRVSDGETIHCFLAFVQIECSLKNVNIRLNKPNYSFNNSRPNKLIFDSQVLDVILF
jgi:hypothetical protein